MSDNFIYKFLAGSIDPEDLSEIVRLFHQENWFTNLKTPNDIRRLIDGSFCFLVVYKQNKIIGTGRLLSDGVSDAYIHNIVVDKEFRGRHIGKEIVQRLVDFCIFNNIIWIGLIAEPGTESFYEKSGFKVMEDHRPMVLRI